MLAGSVEDLGYEQGAASGAIELIHCVCSG